MRFPRTLTTVGAVAALGAATTLTMAPAQAAGPTHSVESIDFTLPTHGGMTEACGFPVSLHVFGSWNVVTFTDDQGNTAKEIRNFRFRGEISAHGVTIQGISRGPEITTFGADGSFTVAVHGVVNRRVPGEGTVTLFSGLTVTDVDADGEHEVQLFQSGPDDENASELCGALTA